MTSPVTRHNGFCQQVVILILLMASLCPLRIAAATSETNATTRTPATLTAEEWLRDHPDPDHADDREYEDEPTTNIEKIRSWHQHDNYKAENDSNRDWWHLAKKGYFNPKDTTVKYSRFMKLFCKVYNWGDRVFNSYDTTYVVGFGKNWKARLAFDAWTDSYNMNFDGKMPMTFISKPYSSIGAYLHFMAVSVSYQLDINKVFFNQPINHKKFDFGFNCARFNAELSFAHNNGGTYIRHFGDYRDSKGNKIISMYFPGLKNNTLNFQIYYFFNNRKYANGAAYSFSKYQKKSAGSFLLGFNYIYQDIRFDFSRLPEPLLPYLTWDNTKYTFHYNDYCLMFGYTYNWVLNKHFLYNISAMPTIGVTSCYEDNEGGKGTLLSLNAAGKMSLTYNDKDFFMCLILKASGQLYHTNKLTVFSSIENLQFSVGFRF